MGDVRTVLIVDDEKDFAEMIAFQLKAHGYYVETAYDGVEGLKKLQEGRVNLVLLDITMPRMGGIEFFQNICSKDGHPRYLVFVMTARAYMEKMFEDMDVAGFLAKPFEVAELIKKIDGIFSMMDSLRQKPKSADQEGGVLVEGELLHVPQALALAMKDKERVLEMGDQRMGLADLDSTGSDALKTPGPAKRINKVLILENDMDFYQKLRHLFEAHGFVVDVAYTPARCIEAALKLSPGWIITKDVPSGMQVTTMISLIREMTNMHDVPILVYGYGDIQAKHKALGEVPNIYLVPHVSEAKLFKKIQDIQSGPG